VWSSVTTPPPPSSRSFPYPNDWTVIEPLHNEPAGPGSFLGDAGNGDDARAVIQIGRERRRCLFVRPVSLLRSGLSWSEGFGTGPLRF
jgi:hypothetical protein